MAPRTTRTRKSNFSAPGEPTEELPEPAPSRRRAPSPRAATVRRPAASSRTLRPVAPAGEPVAAEAVPQPPLPPAVAPLAAAPDPVAQPAPGGPEPEQARAVEPPSAPAPEPPVAQQETAGPGPTSEPAPASEPPIMVELQTAVRELQGLVAERTEQTAQGLANTTLQIVRMVTGIAYHLDQLVEKVQHISGVTERLAQSLTHIESAVAALDRSTQDQLALLSGEVAGLRAQRARDATLERLEQYRAMVELKQLRQAIENNGIPPALARAVPRASRAAAKR